MEIEYNGLDLSQNTGDLSFFSTPLELLSSLILRTTTPEEKSLQVPSLFKIRVDRHAERYAANPASH
jgi:hypothetical protein